METLLRFCTDPSSRSLLSSAFVGGLLGGFAGIALERSGAIQSNTSPPVLGPLVGLLLLGAFALPVLWVRFAGTGYAMMAREWLLTRSVREALRREGRMEDLAEFDRSRQMSASIIRLASHWQESGRAVPKHLPRLVDELRSQKH